jgi:RNA polymerase sigma factor (sigma-70 family)|tara:strand:+ start:1130 stop:1711 length:582 start_codon:yes stop_codon:yes gene_type:complete
MQINDELIKQWEPKVQKMASSVYILGLDREDLAQELRLAVVKAAQGFEEDRGVVFHTYLHTAMTNTIRTLLSKGRKLVPVTTSLDDIFSDFSDMPLQSYEILEALTDPSDFTVDVEFKEFITTCLLDTQEQGFITLRLEGLTMEEITEDLGESSYKLRQTVREKLLRGVMHEKTISVWGDDSQQEVDRDGRRV